jgi:uncharacterized membrane protein
MTTTRKLAVALACSLALNLFFAGFLTARALRRHDVYDDRPPHGPSAGPRGPRRDADLAADEGVRRALRRHEDTFRSRGKDLRAARAKVSVAFAAEPFDTAALSSALTELRAQTSESQRMLHDTLVEMAPTLSPEQRARLSKHALERDFGPGRRRR